EVLAEHFEKANQNERAVEYFKLAAENAEAKTANAEAINYAEQALKLLPTLTAGTGRDRTELALVLVQAIGFGRCAGFGHPETGRVFDRAEALLSDAQDPVAQGTTLGFLWGASQFRGQFETALRFSERVVSLGQKSRL